MSKVRCPSCGGLNPAGAQWCGQCHARFTPPPPPPPAPTAPHATGEGVPAPAPAGPPGPAAAAVAAPPARETAADEHAPAGRGGRLVVKGDFVGWVCASCETTNAVGETTCTVCGAAFRDTVKASEGEPPPRDPGTAALLSLFLPGAGHAYVGNWAQAIARMVLSAWVALVAVLAAIQRGTPALNPFSMAFGAATFVLWVAAAHDAYREARREPDRAVLKGRAFLYVVLGLLALLLVLLMGSIRGTPEV